MYQPEELKSRYKGVSSSSLTWFRLSAKYFRDKIDRKIEEPEFSFLELGTKLHYYLLEPQKFNDLYIYLSSPTPSNPKQKEFCLEFAKNLSDVRDMKTEKEIAKNTYKKIYATEKKSEAKIEGEALKIVYQYSEYINYLRKADTYKDVINYSTNKFLEDAKRSVASHKAASQLLTNYGYSTIENIVTQDYIESNEVTIYWEHPKFLINGEPMVCKSRIDRLVIDHLSKTIKVIDLKTTSEMNSFKRKFKQFRYNEQLAFYWMAITYMFKKLYPEKNISDYKKETYIVVVSTTPTDSIYTLPVECKVFEVTDDTEDKWLTSGLDAIEETLQDMIWYFENDLWDHAREYYEGNGVETI